MNGPLPGVATSRHRSLAWRLGLLLGIAVIAVLLLVGVVVNRVVSSSYQTVLTDQQQQRLDDAAVTLADRLSRPVGLARAQALVMRLATTLGGEVTVTSMDGTTLAAYGRPPGGDVTTYTTPIELDGQVVANLEADIPARAGDRGFLPLFNVTLAVAGLISVLGIVLVSTSIAGRLTRPLRDVAAAARRLEAGDASARATGGDDQESVELADAFNAMADRLERSEMLRRRAASDIAHDLATPATVLESQLQAMIDGVVPNDVAGLEAARSAAAALGGVVGRHRRPRARRGRARSRRGPAAVDLTTAIPEIALALDGPRRDRSARLEVEVHAGHRRLGRSRSPCPGGPQRGRQRPGPQPGRRRRRGHGRPRRQRGPDPGHRPRSRDRARRRRATSSSGSTGPIPRAPPIPPPAARPVWGSA